MKNGGKHTKRSFKIHTPHLTAKQADTEDREEDERVILKWILL